MRQKETLMGFYCHQLDEIRVIARSAYNSTIKICNHITHISVICKTKWKDEQLFKKIYLLKEVPIFFPLLFRFFFFNSKSGDLVSLSLIIMALSQQLFLLFVLSSCPTLTSASKALYFCLTVNRWNSEMHLPHLIPQLFFFYYLFFLLTDNLFRSPGVLLICNQQDIWIQCEQNVLLWASPMQVVLNYERSSMMFFLCAVSPQHSTVWSAYLVFIFLMIASITLLYQRLFFIEG